MEVHKVSLVVDRFSLFTEANSGCHCMQSYVIDELTWLRRMSLLVLAYSRIWQTPFYNVLIDEWPPAGSPGCWSTRTVQTGEKNFPTFRWCLCQHSSTAGRSRPAQRCLRREPRGRPGTQVCEREEPEESVSWGRCQCPICNINERVSSVTMKSSPKAVTSNLAQDFFSSEETLQQNESSVILSFLP